MSLAHRHGPLGQRPFGDLVLAEGRWLYVEPSPKRVRMTMAGATVADSTSARLLHQPDAPATWWFPHTDVRQDLLVDAGDREHLAVLGETHYFDLRHDRPVRRRVAHIHPAIAALDGLIHLDTFQADGVYEEDEPVAAEAVDPFHRVDVRDASRRVRISLDGIVIAESHAPRMVFETTARPRFYLATDEVRTDLLVASHRPAICQYKGDGEYFHVDLGDRLVGDLVWRYTTPRDDGRRLAGRYAVHHERCHTEVDGRVLPDGGHGAARS